jgi:hypothetical protein
VVCAIQRSRKRVEQIVFTKPNLKGGDGDLNRARFDCLIRVRCKTNTKGEERNA